ncbi:hypothetical protein KP509_23G012700 [Ceratopteris richardii]|uniref:Uncharacterized protein n=1 Tax=Ceratopteris richardii TaxID=49495 RepID=A0A8T2RZW7_CERRI|nr:hypothetical protein KP509_23G012700 [Ceratopteris richardii]
MGKSGWGKLPKQQLLQEDGLYSKTAKGKEQQQLQRTAYQHRAEIEAMNRKSGLCPEHLMSMQDPASASLAAMPKAPAPMMLQEAALGETSIKVTKLLQILRKWKAQSARQVAARRRQSSKPVPRSALATCSRLSLVPLSCVNITLLSEDDDDDEDETADDSSIVRGQHRSPRIMTPTRQMASPRTLSYSKLSSPLRACTPFASAMYFEGDKTDDLECLQPLHRQTASDNCIAAAAGRRSPSWYPSPKQPSTPKGYLALYVGEEKKRFLVKANLLNHPLFGVLLEKAKEEFGFEQPGPLYIPCEISFFQQIMLLVESKDPLHRNADMSTVLVHHSRAELSGNSGIQMTATVG